MKWAWMVVLALWVGACAVNTGRIPEPTPKMAMKLGVAHVELVRGHATYLQHCNRCHERVPPGKNRP